MALIHTTLYNYLLEKGDEWTPQVQVARDLYGIYGNGEAFLEPSEYHNTTERTLLSHTISEINFNPEFEKIIISSSKGIKIANESEFYRYISSQHKSALRKLARVYVMAKKGDRNNQIDFSGDTVESFLKNFSEAT